MNRLKYKRSIAPMMQPLYFSALAAFLWLGQLSNLNADTLTIGSNAPSIDIEHWVHNGEGRFPKVEKFEPGKVYIVEFWATWCGPCIASMPHIVDVQNKYAEKGVQFISISDEKLDIVEKFLEKRIPNAKDDGPSTYAELTKSYCLTTDPDMSAKRDYLISAERHGIPCCFIVGKDAKIEWIGHPMRMDDPLHQVVEGTWDREVFGKHFRIEHAREELMYQTRAQIAAANKKKDYSKIVQVVDEALAMADTADLKFDFMAMKLPAMAMESATPASMDSVLTTMFDLSEEFSSNTKPLKILSASKLAYELFIDDRLPNTELIERAKRQVSSVIMNLPSTTKATALDLLSHLQFVTGDLAGAIASQRQAVNLATGKRQEALQKFLDELNASAEDGTNKKGTDK